MGVTMPMWQLVHLICEFQCTESDQHVIIWLQQAIEKGEAEVSDKEVILRKKERSEQKTN